MNNLELEVVSKPQIVLKYTLVILITIQFGIADIMAQSRRTQAADEDFENLRFSLAIPKYKKAYSKTKGNKNEKNRQGTSVWL